MDPATRVPPGSSVHDQPRWHYRRSLASRVILMTTLAVCFAVALVSLGAYVTVKMSLENSLDDSLLDRAHETAASAPLEAVQSEQIPTYAAGVADVRLFVLAANGHAKIGRASCRERV